jgi:hypothetical protein
MPYVAGFHHSPGFGVRPSAFSPPPGNGSETAMARWLRDEVRNEPPVAPGLASVHKYETAAAIAPDPQQRTFVLGVLRQS